MGLKGVIFDLDGTVVDVAYDWSRIKAELGTQGIPILTYLSGLKEPEKSRKQKILEGYEAEGAKKAQLKRGMRRFLNLLAQYGVKKALVTNNSRETVEFLQRKFDLKFDCVISREGGHWKPSGAPFIDALDKLGLMKEDVAVVGDSVFDIKAGREAGIEKIFLLSQDEKKFGGSGAEVFQTVRGLQQRIQHLLTRARGQE
jgi:HAD superfamily hydrolase (TIGR01549 family)